MSRPIVPPAAPFHASGAKSNSKTSKTNKSGKGASSAAAMKNKHQFRRTPRRSRLEIMSSQTKLIFRITAFALIMGQLLSKTYFDYLLPHGRPEKLSERPSPLPIDRNSDLLRFRHGRTQRIYERVEENVKPKLHGPETVVINPKTGDLYVMTANARLLQLSDLEIDSNDATRVTAKATDLHSLGAGRPLGGAFTADGKTLYVADAVLGLTRLHNPTDPKAKVELVVDTIATKNTNGTLVHERLWYVDDVCIGPKSGNVYFTDATDIAPERFGHKQKAHWDTLFASKLDLVRGRPMGRVLEYNPTTDTTRVLVGDLNFANGIAVDKDEQYLIVSQTFGPRVSKYYLKGDKAGTLETILGPNQLTGYPDGADCAWEGNRKCYAVLPSAFSPIHALYSKLPDPMDRVLRVILLLLPRWLAPRVQKYGGIVEFDPMTKVHRYIQDPTGKDIAMLTGVTIYNNKLYLGSLENDYIGVYTLEASEL
ncbi:hypothetical protein MPSEU_000984300 [Mayamaea pseudoterrestris]|nr:hypothetical protein MPSEU_000984300 [Mayamaea pseudoterrestris]